MILLLELIIAIESYRIPTTGTIELNEIRQVMRKLGQNPTEEELQEMISSVDDNGDKEIDFEEFLILMKSRCLEQDPEKELRDAFAVFDTDGSGSIDRKELKRLMKKLGQALTEAEVDAMMDEVDANGDGEISYEEFKLMMVRFLFSYSEAIAVAELGGMIRKRFPSWFGWLLKSCFVSRFIFSIAIVLFSHPRLLFLLRYRAIASIANIYSTSLNKMLLDNSKAKWIGYS
jgi:calmodulin